MGQSTDGILFYGYVWADEGVRLFPDEDDNGYWYNALARRRGHLDPWQYYRTSGAEAEHASLRYEEQRGAYERWKAEVGFQALLDVWDAVIKSIKAEFSADISSHCSCDYPMPYIYIRGTKVTAYRGSAVEIPVAAIAESPLDEWNAELDRFIEALAIDMSEPEYGDGPQGPGWFLVSNWC